MDVKIGVSTASLYPAPTEVALKYLSEQGVRYTELFLNTPSELSDSYLEQLCKIVDSSKIKVQAIHPYTSELESLLFFSDYPRRVEDGLELYRRYFEIGKKLKSKYLIFHGQNLRNPYPSASGFKNMEKLLALAKDYGMNLLQENVARCVSSQPSYICEMKKYFGNEIGFTLDIKQSLRSGLLWEEVLEEMGENLRHVHLSDHDLAHDCLLPGEGSMDLSSLKRKLEDKNFTGSLLIELYRQNYKNKEDLIRSYRFLEQKFS